MSRRSPGLAHVAPLVAFLMVGLLTGLGLAGKSAAALWVYPLQTWVGLALVLYFWPVYEFGPVRWGGIGWAVLAAPLALWLWIAPSWWYVRFGAPAWMEGRIPGPGMPIRVLLGMMERTDGFNPAAHEGSVIPAVAWLALRFVRLVLVTPLIEEICWRGYVMRLVDDPDRPFFENPFGRHRWKTYGMVTALVMLVHEPADWFGAFCFGSVAYALAVKTKSLGTCVLFHALVNLLLGVHVMVSRQWGYW